MANPESTYEKIVRTHFNVFEPKIRRALSWNSPASLDEMKPSLPSWRTESGKATPDGLLRNSETGAKAIIDFKVGVRQEWKEVEEQMLDYRRGAKQAFGVDTPLVLVSYYEAKGVRQAGLLPIKVRFSEAIEVALRCYDLSHKRAHAHFSIDPEYGDYVCVETGDIWSKEYDLPLPCTQRDAPWPRKGPRNDIFRFIHDNRNISHRDLIQWAERKGHQTTGLTAFGIVLYKSEGRIKYSITPRRDMPGTIPIDIVWPRKD